MVEYCSREGGLKKTQIVHQTQVAGIGHSLYTQGMVTANAGVVLSVMHFCRCGCWMLAYENEALNGTALAMDHCSVVED